MDIEEKTSVTECIKLLRFSLKIHTHNLELSALTLDFFEDLHTYINGNLFQINSREDEPETVFPPMIRGGNQFRRVFTFRQAPRRVSLKQSAPLVILTPPS